MTERDQKRAEHRETQKPQLPLIPQSTAPTVIYQSAAHPTITAMQVRKEKELELAANDKYWSERLKKQEEEFLKNNKILEKEFNDTVSHFHL